MYVRIKYKTALFEKLSGYITFDYRNSLNYEKLRKWLYYEYVDPLSIAHEDQERIKLRARGYQEVNNYAKIYNVEIKTDLETKKETIDKIPNSVVTAKLSNNCDEVEISFLLIVTTFHSAVNLLFEGLFEIPKEWYIEIKRPLVNDITISEEHYQEILSRENIALIRFGNVICDKTTFLKTLNKDLYEKYALLRD